MMLTVISGAARSGKSTLAESLARAHPGPVTYIATAEAKDDEMKRRIELHRSRRPPGWTTLEEPLRLARAVRQAESAAVLVDCLSMWVSNRLLQCSDSRRREALADELWRECTDAFDHLSAAGREGVVVTNEVGWSVVPQGKLARQYRDLLGVLNQRAAAEADRAVLMALGIPLLLKGEPLPAGLEVSPGG